MSEPSDRVPEGTTQEGSGQEQGVRYIQFSTNEEEVFPTDDDIRKMFYDLFGEHVDDPADRRWWYQQDQEHQEEDKPGGDVSK